jgi:hypothetical protein
MIGRIAYDATRGVGRHYTGAYKQAMRNRSGGGPGSILGAAALLLVWWMSWMFGHHTVWAWIIVAAALVLIPLVIYVGVLIDRKWWRQ